MRYKFPENRQLCWYCANATRPWVCPWVDRFQPVPGWTAEASIIRNRVRRKPVKISSYKITDCPLFEPESADEKPERYPLEFNFSDFHGAILEQAILDWKTIDYGNMKYFSTADGTIKRDELVKFFYSRWFEDLVTSCTDYSPQQIRDMIKVPPKEGKL